MSDLEDDISAMSPEAFASKGNDEIFADIEDFGGRENATRFVAKTAQMRNDIRSLMPDYSYDIRGNKVYAEADKAKFLQVVGQGLTPMGFVKAIQNQTLTEEGYNLFARHYPDWLSLFNINFIQGFREGKIDNNFYWNYLQSRNTTTADFLYRTLDEDMAQQQPQPQRKMRQQSARTNDYAQGGHFQHNEQNY